MTDKELLKLEFMAKWNKLPVWLKYLLPNIISLVLPLILLVALEYVETDGLLQLGLPTFAYTAIKSVLIGYLKNWNDKLSAYQLQNNDNR